MTQRAVLIVGIDPAVVDFSDPALPPGLTAEAVLAGVDAARSQIAALGLAIDTLQTDAGETAEAALTAQLAVRPYAVVVVGGGVRTPSRLTLFETIINTIHRHAPQAAIAFNTSPADVVSAVQRRLPPR